MHEGPSDTISFFWKTALLFLLTYLYTALRLAPFGDEVWDWCMVNRDVYIAAGRPGLATYLNLFAGHGVPYAYCLATAVYFAAAMCLQVRLLGIAPPVGRFVYAALHISVVQYSYAMIDCFQADAVMLGIFLASLSFWLIVRMGKRATGIIGAVLCAAAAASVYQLLLLVIPVLFLVYTLLTAKEGELRTHLMRGLVTAGVCVGAIALYRCASFACMGLVSQSVIDSVNRYQESLVTWGQIDIATHMLHIGKQWCMHLVGAGYAGEYLYATTLIPVVLLSAGILRDSRFSGTERLLYGLIPLALYVLPFLPMAALGEDQGARLYLSEPLACAGLWIALVQQRGWHLKPAAARIAFALSLMVLLKACYTVSDIAFYQHRIYLESQTAFIELKDRIAQLENREGFATGTVPVVISGQWQSELRKADKFNSCIINPSDCFYHKFIGNTQCRGVRESSTPQKELAALLKSMPAWPDAGSLRFYKGEIIVKFDTPRKAENNK